MRRIIPLLIVAQAYLGPAVWLVFSIERDEARAKSVWVTVEPGSTHFDLVVRACAVSATLSLIAILLRGRNVGWWRNASVSGLRTDLIVYALPLFGALCILPYLFS